MLVSKYGGGVGASIEQPPPLPSLPREAPHTSPPFRKEQCTEGQSVITDSEGSCSQLSAKLCTQALFLTLTRILLCSSPFFFGLKFLLGLSAILAYPTPRIRDSSY